MVGVLATLALAVPSLVTAQATYEQQRSQAAIDQQTQITDRFNKAVEQLGAIDNLERRLGGIYSLERIARDSRRDHPTVMEVLSTFVRESTKRACRNGPVPVGTDAQAALTVIGRRNAEWDTDPIDLVNACLRGAKFSGADLTDAYLSGADLTDAYFNDVTLTGAYLNDVTLTGADLTGVDLNSAHLNSADLTGATFLRADLAAAELNIADLSGAKLSGATLLTGADVSGANRLTGADLSGANLTATLLNGTDLSGADLTDASLTDAELTGANLNQVIGLETVEGLPPR